MTTDLFPLVPTEPKGSREAASAFELDQFRRGVASMDRFIANLPDTGTSAGDAVRDDCTTGLIFNSSAGFCDSPDRSR